jgi:hypothetical protein
VTEEPTPPTPQPEPGLPMILALADITSWDIGPAKGSDCTLKLSITVADFERVQLIRALAKGRVVLRVLPLQMRLGEAGVPDTIDAEGCNHTGQRWPYGIVQGRKMEICMDCGLVLQLPPDDEPDDSAEPTPPGDGEPPAEEDPQP